jgi:hypothetical protein
MKNLSERWLGLLILFLCVSSYAQPAIPSQWFYFPTNFDTAFRSPPIAYTTNLILTPIDPDGLYGTVLVLDTTNLTPAFLNYNVLDTSPRTNRNINYAQGTVLFYYAPNWASVSQGGTGPGELAYFLAGGDWSSNSPNGLFAIYADAGGSNIYLGGVGAGDAEIYASAPISWTSNTFHQIGVEWTTGDCEIYLDGALAATGDGVIYVPPRSTWTNGFFIGSDNTGYEQARGAFWDMVTWTQEYGAWYTDGWPYLSNAIVTWQGTGGFGGMMGMSSGFGMMMGSIGAGNLTAIGSSANCFTGANVCITNMSSMPDTNGDGGMTFVFTIEYGTNGLLYDVFATTNLLGTNITNSSWTWLGQGTNSGIYQITNQPSAPSVFTFGGPLSAQSFYVLGTPQTNDNSGFTTAYEGLVIHGSPFSTNNTALPGMPVGWAFSLGLIPTYNYMANSGQRINYTYDPVGRVDLVTGIRAETITTDLEGNVLLAH